jgi:hypothetical protein
MVFKQTLVKHSSEIPLRRALYKTVSDNVNVRVYNGGAGKNALFPYIIIGESRNGSEFDTKTSEGEELVITIHIHTEEYGYDKVDNLTEGVLAALSNMPVDLNDNWCIVSQEVDAGSRKWKYAVDKAQKILYIRYKCEYH